MHLTALGIAAAKALVPATDAEDEAAGETLTLLAPFHASVRVGFRLEAG